MRPGRQAAWLVLSATLACRLASAQGPPNAVLPPQPAEARAVWAARWMADRPAPPSQPPAAASELEATAPDARTTPQPPEAPAAWSLDDLTQLAMRCNPTLVQASMTVQAAQGRYVQAGLYPNPLVGYLADEIGNDGAEGLQGGFIRQEIVTSGKRRLGQAVAGHEVQQARQLWEAQRRRVLNDVRAGYYEVLLAQKTLEVNEQLVQIGDEGVKVTEQLRAALEISRTDVLQARIEAETAGLSLAQARNGYWAAWQRLAAVLGQAEMAPMRLAGDAAKNLPMLDHEDCRARLLAESPELAEARAAVERARCELALQRARRFPNLQVGAAAKYDTGSHSGVADVEVGAPLPLFDRNQGHIIQASANLSSAMNEVRRLELDLQRRFAEAFQQYANAQRKVDAYANAILPNAQASLELTRTGYREGEFGYLTLLLAQRTYFTVNLDYLTSLNELWTRSIELEGLLLRGGLNAASSP